MIPLHRALFSRRKGAQTSRRLASIATSHLLIEEKCFAFGCDTLELFRFVVHVSSVYVRDVSLLVRWLLRGGTVHARFGRNGKGWRARDRARSEINFQ